MLCGLVRMHAIPNLKIFEKEVATTGAGLLSGDHGGIKQRFVF